MAKKESKILVTMQEIAAYTGRPGNTIKEWVRDHNFPAVKIDGRWESNTELIDNFQRRRIEGRMADQAGLAGQTSSHDLHVLDTGLPGEEVT